MTDFAILLQAARANEQLRQQEQARARELDGELCDGCGEYKYDCRCHAGEGEEVLVDLILAVLLDRDLVHTRDGGYDVGPPANREDATAILAALALRR